VGRSAPPIGRARRRAEEAGLTDRVRCEVACADGFPGSGYDLVTCFDCLNDMGDPVAVARHVRSALAALHSQRNAPKAEDSRSAPKREKHACTRS